MRAVQTLLGTYPVVSYGCVLQGKIGAGEPVDLLNLDPSWIQVQ